MQTRRKNYSVEEQKPQESQKRATAKNTKSDSNKEGDEEKQKARRGSKKGPAITPSSKFDFKIKKELFVHSKGMDFEKKYDRDVKMGEGQYGEVLKIINKDTKVPRAMKVIHKVRYGFSEKQQEKLKREIELLKTLDHPNILKIFEYYEDSEKVYIIMELCQGGELFDKIVELGNLSERDSAHIIEQVLSAIYYAHIHKIVHRDLKPENILLEIDSDGNYNIKVIDWGFAILLEDKPLQETLGSPYYVAPEVLKRNYNEKCDIWSCGVILYILLSGSPPFDGRTSTEIIKSIERSSYDLNSSSWALISSEAKDLIKQMLNTDIEKRICAKEALAHPWFKMIKSTEAFHLNSQVVINNLQNLKNFRAERVMQQAVLTFLANQNLCNDEKENLMKTFKKLDKNGDGTLSRDEIIEGFSKIMKKEEAEIEAHRIMERVDIDHSGEIDYTEFIAATMNYKKNVSKESLREAFNLFDQDGNGFIDAHELKSILGGSVPNLTEESWQDVIKEVDSNGDGEISYEEFCEMMFKFI